MVSCYQGMLPSLEEVGYLVAVDGPKRHLVDREQLSSRSYLGSVLRLDE